MRQVFDGDEVLVQKVQHKNYRPEAKIIEVIKRAHPYILGRCEIIDGIGVVTPESAKFNQQILLEPKQDLTSLNGKIVKVAIKKWPTISMQAIGQVTEILGNYLEKGLEIEIALHNHGISNVWSDEVISETAKIASKISTKDKLNRSDLTDLAFVTIDGSDAKDFDDAVFCKPNPRGFKLYVAIADVSHYVKPNSRLDLEAAKRGNSVYFPNLVVPMLPEKLSNDLCSLKPNVERLALVCVAQISKAGNLLEFKFERAVIKSCGRLTYQQVANFLDSEKANSAKSAKDNLEYDGFGTQSVKIVPNLNALNRLYQVLLKARNKRCALDFETTETDIQLDQNGKIKAILPTVRNDAHRLIEECMLIANVAAAKYLQSMQIPSLYRVHDVPHPDKVANLKAFLGPLGLSLQQTGKNKTPNPKDYHHLLTSIQNRPDSHIIQTMLLRSLNQAVYSSKVSEHFGLNFEAYTHFTSPIRRYPDLLVHRAIIFALNCVQLDLKKYRYDLEQLNNLANHCSQTERRADEATREVINWLKCEYMQKHLGASFNGIISTVTNFGVFVLLKDIFVEGLVHVSSLPSDYYYFDKANQMLIGEHGGTKFKLGDKIKIKVARVDLTERKIDFTLQDFSTTKKRRKNNKPK